MTENDFLNFLNDLEEYLVEGATHILQNIPDDPKKIENKSVIGSLLSRQTTLCIQMARAPNILNAHSAPLFLRAMVDLEITLSWILLDVDERVKKYVLYGLGEEKLIIEHYKKEAEDANDQEYKSEILSAIENKENWVRSQKPEYLLEINLGNWAQLDYRKMAQEAGKENLYKFPYKVFSQSAHNMWNYLAFYNSKKCNNPLHRYHTVPALLEAPFDIDYLYRAFKYVDHVWSAIIDKYDIYTPFVFPIDYFEEKL